MTGSLRADRARNGYSRARPRACRVRHPYMTRSTDKRRMGAATAALATFTGLALGPVSSGPEAAGVRDGRRR